MTDRADSPVAQATHLAGAAGAYAAALCDNDWRRAKGMEWMGVGGQIALHRLLVAVIEFTEGNPEAALDALCHDMGWDTEGWPVDEDGFRTGAERYAVSETRTDD